MFVFVFAVTIPAYVFSYVPFLHKHERLLFPICQVMQLVQCILTTLIRYRSSCLPGSPLPAFPSRRASLNTVRGGRPLLHQLSD